MNASNISLEPVDRVEVLTIIDNYVDVLLRNTERITRPPLAKSQKIPSDTLLAEHGLALRVTLYRGETAHTILFDTGYSRVGVPHNLGILDVEMEEVEAIVLSHGHMDHTGSLYDLLDGMQHRVPIVVHPDAFLSPRYFGLDDGRKLMFPQTLTYEQLEKRDVDLIEARSPTLLAEGSLAVTGEIPRTTEFEKGLPNAMVERNGEPEPDPIWDDQAVILHLRGKGLVVISGCSHAGIVNTLRYAADMTGIGEIHAVMGGFHLSGPFFEPIIDETVKAFKRRDPAVIAPMHCTGWNAIVRFSREFPDAFVLNSVGSRITLS